MITASSNFGQLLAISDPLVALGFVAGVLIVVLASSVLLYHWHRYIIRKRTLYIIELLYVVGVLALLSLALTFKNIIV
jgi:hypothetical protein